MSDMRNEKFEAWFAAAYPIINGTRKSYQDASVPELMLAAYTAASVQCEQEPVAWVNNRCSYEIEWNSKFNLKNSTPLYDHPAPVPQGEDDNWTEIADDHAYKSLTNLKTKHVIQQGHKVVGYVLTNGEGMCISYGSAVRWMTPDALYRVMHAIAVPQGEQAARWKHYFDVPDKLADKALSACVPGGSSVRAWFLPHESDKAIANVRDAMKCALLAVMPQGEQCPSVWISVDDFKKRLAYGPNDEAAIGAYDLLAELNQVASSTPPKDAQ